MTVHKHETSDALSIHLNGPLCIYSVTTLWEEARLDPSDSRSLNIELSGVTECDAAGVQMIVEWVRHGRQRGRTVTIADETGVAVKAFWAAGLPADWMSVAMKENDNG